MIVARIKQGLRFIFGRYKKENDKEVRKILSASEFEIFQKMSEYEKIHSFRLYTMVCSDDILGGKDIYKKLALLHDCGKDSPGLIRRMKKVLIGDKTLEDHSYKSYEKLKDVNLEVAKLAKIHHTKTDDILMERFQNLDDK